MVSRAWPLAGFYILGSRLMVSRAWPLAGFYILGSRLMVGQQPLELFILGSNPSSPAELGYIGLDRVL